MPNNLTSQIRAAASITEAEHAALFALFRRHYDAATSGAFARDLAAKDDVILLTDRASGALAGFSTQVVERYSVSGDPVRVLFSGDTIIDPAHWGEQELVRSWCRYAGAALASAESAGEPLYWLLISKGYRTYLYLPLFFRYYFPSRAPTPDLRRTASEIARQRFGDPFCTRTGCLKFARSCGHLHGTLAEVPEKRRSDPHVRLFLERNPGFASGDELVCLAPITAENMRSFAARHLRYGMLDAQLQCATPC
ncbi:hypothetical protein BH23VER1_BH23VER1_23020 [soil metagenome]